MTLTVTHTYVSAVADDPAAASAGEVLPSHWNASHTLSGSGTLTEIDDTNVTLTLGGTPTGALINNVSLTAGWTGTLGLARGGTNADLSATGAAKNYLKQISAGANVTVGTIPASDIASGAALTKVDDTNVTLTLGGTPATSLLSASSITAGWTGTLAAGRLNANVVQGVTNDTNITGTISAQNLTFAWSGTLGVSRGGTGTGTAFTQGSIPFAGASGVYTQDNAALSWDDTNKCLTFGGGTVTASTPVLNITQTWNNAAVNFTGGQISITRTAANVGASYDWHIIDTGTGTNDQRYVDVIDVRTTGAPAAGLGGTRRVLLQNQAGNPTFACDLNVFWNDPTTGHEYSQANFDIMSNGASYTAWSCNFDGSFQWRPFYANITSRSPDPGGEMPSVYKNNGAAATINLQDSSAYAGKTVTFLVDNAAGVTINAVSAKLIYMGGNTASAVPGRTTAGGHITSTAIGSSVVLMSDNGGNYFATSFTGTWTAA